MSAINIVLILLGLAIACVVFLLIIKIKRIKQLNSQVSKLKKFVDEMDEQARLIVRTDIELNRTQDDLDKKISGLYSLQKLSREMSTTLQEELIFLKIDHSHLEELGFEKTCAFLWNDAEDRFMIQLNVGYGEEYIKNITLAIDEDKKIYSSLMKSAEILSSISPSLDSRVKARIDAVFAVNYFIISPILPKEGAKGFLFVGTENKDVTLTEGDEELINILSNQLGQALENARLFEKSWRAQQELERKVEERTRALSLALEEVKAVSKRKTDFISSVSHELRTPLTSIKGYAAILLEEKLGKLPNAVKERLERVNHHSDVLAGMVNDLLDIARIESGKTVMKLGKYELAEIISTVSDLISVQCKNKNIQLSCDVEKDIPQILIDRNQIERVFINLLGNAVKFTPEKGKITIRAKKQNQTVQFDIQDTGIGIPSESIPKLFDEFYRVDNPINEEAKGTGLGLSLVKNIVEAHNGKIWVESVVGKGTTLSFTLPLQ